MYEKLFAPIRLGRVEVKNRVVAAPLGWGWLHPDGLVTNAFLAHYAAKAKGGVGLIIKGNVWVSEWAMGNTTGYLRLYENDHIAGIAEFAEVIHAYDAKLFLQLSTGWGAQSPSLGQEGRLPATPSGISYGPIPKGKISKGLEVTAGIMGPPCRAMTVEEIQRQVEAIGRSAQMALIAGADGVEIHAPHGYLLHQFLSPRFNRRTDHYGGSLENRMRYLVEQVQSVRAAVGKHIALGVRISGDEHMPGGLEHKEVRVICKSIEELGVDYIHLSDGCLEARKYMEPHSDKIAEHVVTHAESLKKVVKVPVMTPSLHDPAVAERVVREGKADMVSLARQLIIDPEWPSKVKKGRVSDINRCRRCNICLQRRWFNLPIRCAHNPNAGREIYMQEYQPPLLKKTYIPNVKVLSELMGDG